MTRALRLALTTFRSGDTAALPDVRRALLLSPLAGLLLGLAGAAASVVVRLFFRDYAAPFLPSVLAVGTVALLTRGATWRGVEAYGTVPLAFVLLVQVAALSEATASQRGSIAVLVAFTTGRLALTMSGTRATATRDRAGLAWVVTGTLRRWPAFGTAALVTAAAYAAAAADDHAGSRGGVRAALAVVLALAVAHGLRWRRAMSGDALRLTVEVATAVALTVMALDLNCLPHSGLARLLGDRCTF